MKFLIRHYEKLILLVLLLLLLNCLNQTNKKTTQLTKELFQTVKSSEKKVKSGEMIPVESNSQYNLERYLGDPSRTLSVASPEIEGEPKSTLMMPPKLIKCPNEACGLLISLKMDTCPFCGTQLDPIAPEATEKDDLDKDGLPDYWEKKYETVVNWRNPNDPLQDPDEDCFLNVEEFNGKSDPSDASSFPPLIGLLRISRITFAQIDLKLGSVDTNGSQDKAQWAISLRCIDPTKRRLVTMEGKVGDTLGEWKILSADMKKDETGEEEGTVVVASIKNPDEKYELPKDWNSKTKKVARKKATVRFVYLTSRRPGDVSRLEKVSATEGEVFTLTKAKKEVKYEEKYKLLSVNLKEKTAQVAPLSEDGKTLGDEVTVRLFDMKADMLLPDNAESRQRDQLEDEKGGMDEER